MRHAASLPAHQSILVDSPVSQTYCPGVISLDPAMAESPSSGPTSGASALTGRKGGGGRSGKTGKKKEDPNEPQKPVPAYALFFRDTQAAIKGQNPKATIGEVSKIVASMWDSLGKEQKQVMRSICLLCYLDFRVTLRVTNGSLLSYRFTRGKMN